MLCTLLYVSTNSFTRETLSPESKDAETDAVDVVTEFSLNSYPSIKSVTVFVDLVTVTPLIFILASAAATTCLLEFVDEVSNAANPGSLLSSVTLNLRALLAPVSEFMIRENVPSPLSVTVALTPYGKERDEANPDKVLFELETTTDCDALVVLLVKVFPLQDPKSISTVPKLIAAFLLEKSP